jgi:hypothetical protein
MILLACAAPATSPVIPPQSTIEESIVTATTVVTASTVVTAGDCTKAKNTCPDYSPAWGTACPAGQRCITFTNNCAQPVALAYQVGCDGDGKPGAPQCNCTNGPTLPAGGSATWTITDGNYTSCLPSWTPACLTAGLAVLANPMTPSCTSGTRVEFTAGNSGDPYGKADFYDIDVEKGYSVPVHFAPALTCAHDTANHDCRPLWCGSETCPDAYATPTTGGCADGRSPQAGCQDTFSKPAGFTVTFCPLDCPTSGCETCPSCQDATACP